MVDHNNTKTLQKPHTKHIRTTINMNAEVFDRLFLIRAEILKITRHDISTSLLVSTLCGLACGDYDNKEIAKTIISESKRFRN